MQTPTPGAKAPRTQQLEAGHGQSWWADRFQSSALRTRHRRKLPLVGALVASAVLPFGLWTPTESPVRAQAGAPNAQAPSAPADATAAQPSTSTFAVPATQSAAPAAEKFAPSVAPRADAVTWNVRAIVGGRIVPGRVEVPGSGVTVARVLSELNIEVGPLDRVFPAGSSAAYNGMAIRVKRVAAPLHKRMQATPFETRYLPTSTLRPGKRGVVVEGQSGAIEITERVWSIDGKVSRREYVSHRVARAPQMRIVGLGARSSYVPGRVPYHKRYARAFSGPQTRLASRAGSPRDRFLRPGGTPLRAWKVVELVATGYSPDPRENGGYTVTATGLPIGYGAAATDPRVIPLGTKMYVEGYGYAFACDVGGAIKGRRIDLAYNSYREANTKGRKKVRVWLLAE